MVSKKKAGPYKNNQSKSKLLNFCWYEQSKSRNKSVKQCKKIAAKIKEKVIKHQNYILEFISNTNGWKIMEKRSKKRQIQNSEITPLKRISITFKT